MLRFSINALFLLSFSVAVLGQNDGKFIRFYGKTLSKKDSSAVMTSITYEKLPYYDDMGMGRTPRDGSYEFYLVDKHEYNFKLTSPGFITLDEVITVSDSDGDASYNYNFYIEPEEVPDVITLHNLNFATNSDRITPSSFEELDELASYMDSNPTIVIQLEGHTDFGGNADAALELSLARVDAVKAYLQDKDVKRNRILTRAFGGTQPIVTEGTREERAKNRRVEVRIIER